MPTNRRRRRRAMTSGPFDDTAAGDEIAYTPQRWDAILGAVFFGGQRLPPHVNAQWRQLLDGWMNQHLEYERSLRGD